MLHLCSGSEILQVTGLLSWAPGSEMSVPAQRYVVTHGLRRLRVERHTPSAPPQQITASREDLAEMLLDKMTEACK